MPIIDQLNSKGVIVELGHGDVYIACGEDHQHVINSIMMISHDSPHKVGEMHKELQGKPITDFDKAVVIHFAEDAIQSAEILQECLLAVINRMKGVPDGMTLESQLLGILMMHAGEAGHSEGAVECLKRIIDERDKARLQLGRYVELGRGPLIKNIISGVSNG